ncbi:hypothetical protein SESBI_49037 [Sesbania bispinosa]|nr:hypothetical protein SESBI_49037 [Sesbania bispinosa]
MEENMGEALNDLNALKSERDNLKAEVSSLKEEINSRDDKIGNLERHLNKLQMEHVELIEGMEEAQRHVGELKSRGKELEEEIEKQRIEFLQGAEEKREAIRQLCFSLEHYKDKKASCLLFLKTEVYRPGRGARVSPE